MQATETWKITAPNRTPHQVAQEFADTLYPGRRAVDFDGAWVCGVRYSGTFRLFDGARTYVIVGNLLGEYEVSPE